MRFVEVLDLLDFPSAKGARPGWRRLLKALKALLREPFRTSARPRLVPARFFPFYGIGGRHRAMRKASVFTTRGFLTWLLPPTQPGAANVRTSTAMAGPHDAGAGICVSAGADFNAIGLA